MDEGRQGLHLGSQPILAETSKYKSKECSGKKVKLFSFVVIFTYVNIFSYSSKNIHVSGGGPGACLGISGGGQGRSIDGFELRPPPMLCPKKSLPMKCPCP